MIFGVKRGAETVKELPQEMTSSPKLINGIFGPSSEIPGALLSSFWPSWIALGGSVWPHFGSQRLPLSVPPALLDSKKALGPDLNPIWDPKLVIWGSYFGPDTQKEDVENDF